MLSRCYLIMVLFIHLLALPETLLTQWSKCLVKDIIPEMRACLIKMLALQAQEAGFSACDTHKNARCGNKLLYAQHWGSGDRQVPRAHSLARQPVYSVSSRPARDSIKKNQNNKKTNKMVSSPCGILPELVLWPSHA